MTDDTIAPSTTIADPGPSAGELEMLLFSLDRSRATFAWKVGGLDAEALHRAHPPSVMTLAGLIKHLALVEDLKTGDLFGWPDGAPWDRSAWDDDPDWEWHSAAADSAADLYALWQGAVARSRAAWTTATLAPGVSLDDPAQEDWGSHASPSLRRILVDLTDEYARHVGHADLFRETIDGLVGEDPPQD
jgi:hypothetical protein